MELSFIKIPIHRFIPEKPLSVDVYVFLEKNNKNIRIVYAGNALTEIQLEKIKSGGHQFLHIPWESSLGKDPETYPLFMEGAINTTSLQEKTAVLSSNTEEDSTNPRDLEIINEESERSAKAMAPLTEPSEEKVASKEEEANVDEVLAEASSEEFHRFSSESDIEDQKKIQGDTPLSEEEQNISNENHSTIEEETIISATEEDDPIVQIKIKLETSKKEIEQGVFLGLDRNELQTDSILAVVSGKISEEIVETALRLKNSSEAEDKVRISGHMEQLIETLQKVKGGGEIEEELIMKFNCKDEIESVKMHFSSVSEEELVQKISQKVDDANESNNKAVKAIEQYKAHKLSLTRAHQTKRALPETVGRLSTYLAHSLGYTSVDFLAELALSSILTISQRNGADIPEAAFPVLASEEYQKSPSANIASEDYRKIVFVLESYLFDPNCDWSQKDLHKKLFYETLEKISREESILDPISCARWLNLAEKGPSIDAHGLCAKASSLAVKNSRDCLQADS